MSICESFFLTSWRRQPQSKSNQSKEHQLEQQDHGYEYILKDRITPPPPIYFFERWRCVRGYSWWSASARTSWFAEPQRREICPSGRAPSTKWSRRTLFEGPRSWRRGPPGERLDKGCIRVLAQKTLENNYDINNTTKNSTTRKGRHTQAGRMRNQSRESRATHCK